MSTTSMAIFSNPLFATYSVYARNASIVTVNCRLSLSQLNIHRLMTSFSCLKHSKANVADSYMENIAYCVNAMHALSAVAELVVAVLCGTGHWVSRCGGSADRWLQEQHRVPVPAVEVQRRLAEDHSSRHDVSWRERTLTVARGNVAVQLQVQSWVSVACHWVTFMRLTNTYLFLLVSCLPMHFYLVPC